MRKDIKIDFSPGYFQMIVRFDKLQLIHEEQIKELFEYLIYKNNKILGLESVEKWDVDNCISFMKTLNPIFSIPDNFWWKLDGMTQTLIERAF